MTQQPQRDTEKDRWGKDQWDVLEDFLRERGITRFGEFGTSGEGSYLPTGLETISCAILTPNEKVSFYILKWDENKVAPDGTKGYYTFSVRPWEPEEIAREQHSTEYLRARKQLNLPLTEEQERILREWEAEHPHN